MTRKALLAIGLGFYAATLIAQAPATLVDFGLRQATHGRLRLTQAQGTLWSGTGFIEIRDQGNRNAIVKRTAWRVLPESLWRIRLVCEVQLAGMTQHVPVAVSFSKVEIGNVEVNLPAAALTFAEARLKPLRLSGDLVLQTSNLSIAREGMLGDLTLQWRAAASALSQVSPLGSYELKLEGQGRTVTAMLRTLQGPLQLDGSGSWTTGKKADFLATFRVPPDYRDQLAPILRLISVQRDEGIFDLQLK